MLTTLDLVVVVAAAVAFAVAVVAAVAAVAAVDVENVCVAEAARSSEGNKETISSLRKSPSSSFGEEDEEGGLGQAEVVSPDDEGRVVRGVVAGEPGGRGLVPGVLAVKGIELGTLQL